MCGVGGFLAARPLPIAEAEARLRRMVDSLRHRGPDDEGIWSNGRAGLAHARLSVIDLSAAAHQPMASADGTVWISYNGEVYNFAEIGRELAAKGYRFRSRSDTEVIVNGWHAWGPRVFSRLRGMFALALWDSREARLILARDRLGEKPLHYTADGSVFLFGSEIKTLFTWPGSPRAADLGVIDRYLTFGYVPAPQTAFSGIRKLPPAHYLTIGVAADGSLGAPELARYWELPSPACQNAASAADLQAELASRLEEAVRLRMVGDVPIGAFLSGGIDSSSVVAMLARAGGGPIKTFSIGFSERGYDETRYARLVARRYATDHDEFIVEPDAVSVLPRLVWHYGEPFADPSAIPTYYLCEIARRRVKVALNGDGGDECFLGYNRYRAMRHLARLDLLPEWSRLALSRPLGLFPETLKRRFKLREIRAMLEAPVAAPELRYAASLAYLSEAQKRELYGEAMGSVDSRAFSLFDPYFALIEDHLEAANRADIHIYLPDDLLVKVDIASMAHGLEARSPFLDHELVEWATALPASLRMRGGVTKALLKSAMAPYLPKPVLARKKAGFNCPVGAWLRTKMKDLAYDALLSPTARQRGLFRPDRVRALLDEHASGQRDHQKGLWAMLMLELWFQMWIDATAETAVLRPAA